MVNNTTQLMADLTHAEGQVSESLHLAAKAAAEGKWEKATAYGTIAQAWSVERDRIEKRLRELS